MASTLPLRVSCPDANASGLSCRGRAVRRAPIRPQLAGWRYLNPAWSSNLQPPATSPNLFPLAAPAPPRAVTAAAAMRPKCDIFATAAPTSPLLHLTRQLNVLTAAPTLAPRTTTTTSCFGRNLARLRLAASIETERRTSGSSGPATAPTPAVRPGDGNSGERREADDDVRAEYSTGTGSAVMDNSSIVSMDWNDWMTSSSSSSDGAEGGLSGIEEILTAGADGGRVAAGAGGADAGGGGGSGGGAAAGAAAASSAPAMTIGAASTTVRITFYAVAASFDRKQLEARLRAAYGNQVVRKYPDVIHCQLSRGREGQPGTDVFFFDYGVVACWGLSPEAERDLVRNLAVQCAVQPLAERDQERDVFRCTFTNTPLEGVVQHMGEFRAEGDAAAAPPPATPEPPAPPPPPATTVNDVLGSMIDVDGSGGSLGSVSGTISSRRNTRRAERNSGAVAAVAAATPLAAAPAPPPPPPPPPPPAPVLGPFSLLSFPPKISDDTVLLHVRHCGDVATLLAVSYALAQSTKLSAFEKAVEAIVRDTQGLPEALAEDGEVHLSGKEIGRLIGKVFVLKRSVNLLGSVAETPEFFWYAPDQLQSLYMRITQYVELNERVEQLNGRFSVLQELLELLRAQEEDRHGTRLELVVIWLIVVEVVLGVFELLELFGVIGPKHGF